MDHLNAFWLVPLVPGKALTRSPTRCPARPQLAPPGAELASERQEAEGCSSSWDFPAVPGKGGGLGAQPLWTLSCCLGFGSWAAREASWLGLLGTQWPQPAQGHRGLCPPADGNYHLKHEACPLFTFGLSRALLLILGTPGSTGPSWAVALGGLLCSGCCRKGGTTS